MQALVTEVALDGAVLDPNTDYAVSGTTVTLTKGAAVAQTLSVRIVTTVDVKATKGQTVFKAVA